MAELSTDTTEWTEWGVEGSAMIAAEELAQAIENFSHRILELVPSGHPVAYKHEILLDRIGRIFWDEGKQPIVSIKEDDEAITWDTNGMRMAKP